MAGLPSPTRPRSSCKRVSSIGSGLARHSFTLSYGLIALALGVAVTNGLFDYHTALVRACFDDHLFARLALVKNGVAFALMGGGAFLFGSAKMTLIGTIVSLGGS